MCEKAKTNVAADKKCKVNYLVGKIGFYKKLAKFNFLIFYIFNFEYNFSPFIFNIAMLTINKIKYKSA